MRTPFILLSAAALVGCSRAEDIQTDVFDAADVFEVVASTDTGTLRYAGRPGLGEVRVVSTLWGAGRNQEIAQDRLDSVSVDAMVVGPTLQVFGSAPGVNRGVDVSISGPETMDLFLDTDNSIRVDDAFGLMDIEGRSVRGSLGGEGQIFATGGDIELFVEPAIPIDFQFTSRLIFETTRDGDINLTLPLGPQYDLTVEARDGDIVVDDLGFSFPPNVSPGRFRGEVGDRNVRIDVFASGTGNVRIVAR